MAASSEDTIALLHRVPAFATLGEADLARVAEVAVPRQFEAGAVVFREGDESNTCYIVRLGQARAIREHPDGRSITLANFGPGDIFGELAMFDNERRSATIETVEATEVIAILGGDMRRLLGEHPDIAVKLVAGARTPPARDQRAPGAAVLPNRAEPGRLRPLAARGRRAESADEGAGTRRCADHRDPGRSGAAGGILA